MMSHTLHLPENRDPTHFAGNETQKQTLTPLPV